MNSFQGPDSLDECSLCNGTGQINRSSFGKMLRNERNILGITQQRADNCYDISYRERRSEPQKVNSNDHRDSARQTEGSFSKQRRV